MSITDRHHDHALACGLAILHEMDASPGLPKHELLSLIVFAILNMLECYEAEMERNINPSIN